MTVDDKTPTLENDNNITAQKDRRAIVFILLILCAIGVVWIVKTSLDNKPVSSSDVTLDEFALEVSEIDLPKLKSFGLPIIIDFGSDGCAPCKEMHPTLVALNKEYRGKALVKFTDVWKYTKAAQGWPVDLIPAQFFFDAQGNPYQSDIAFALNLEYITDESGKIILTKHEGGMTRENFEVILADMGVTL